MGDGMKEASLATVAARAGVSAMTVSRVLRNSPRVSEEARRRVLEAVEAVGYHPNPHVSRLMSLVRSRKKHEIQSVLAVIRDGLDDVPYRYVAMADIQTRAGQHGYKAEEFVLGKGGMSPERLGRILLARGVEGIVVSPQSTPTQLEKLDFSPFSSATFGYGLTVPNLHRASTNMTQGILTAIGKLTERGYRRIGLVVTEWIDHRADHTYSGALLYHQMRTPRRDHVPLLLLPNIGMARGATKFCQWMKEHRPDALITFDSYVPDWLQRRLGMRIPEDVGLVVHDWTAEMKGFAGIHHRRDYVAAAAVDLVATQLMHNEKGIPEVPRQILIPPAFIDGASVRPGGGLKGKRRRI
jgi:DNA-binding LacI/PurR family transcriptional regulator